MAALAVVIALVSSAPYLPLVPDVEVIPLDPGFPDFHALIITLHAIPAGLAMLVGPFQFVRPLRRRFTAAHRWVGRFYLACVAVGSVTGFVAGVVAATGFAAQVGFLLLSALWAYSGWMAYRSIRKGQIQLHRIWMVRNFALAFAAPVLRIVLISLQTFAPTLPFNDIYYVSVWTGVLVPLVFAEWFIVQRTLRPLAQRHGA